MKETLTNLKYIRFFWLLLVMLWLQGTGQTGNLPGWASVRERVVLHTDRDLYFAGEPVCFTASCFSTGGTVDRQVSQVMYVELMDVQSKGPVVQKKFKITGSRVSNSLLVPPGISSGTYLLRAYTLYMRNFPSVDFAHHFVTVVNPDRPAPFGGTSTNGTNPSGYPGAGPGRTVNHQLLNPHRGDMIVANAEALVSGMQIETQSDGQFVHVKLAGSNSGNAAVRGPLRLQVFSKDFRVLAEKEIPLSDLEGSSVSAGDLEPGINYIVVSNSVGELLAVHAHYQPEFNVREIQIETAGSVFGPRDSVRASYTVPGDLGEGGATGALVLEISVTMKGTRLADYQQVPEGYLEDPLAVEDYIRSHPWMSQPEIREILAAHVKAVDLSRFHKTTKFSYPLIPAFIPEIRDLTVSGILRDKATQEPVPDQEIFVSVLFNNPQMHINRTGRDGQFLFALNNLQGINDIFITPETGINGDNDREILIRAPFSPDIPLNGMVSMALDTTHRSLLETLYVNFQVSEKFHGKAEGQSKNRNRTGSFNIDGEKTTVMSSDYIELESLREVFIEIVPNAKIRRNGDRFSIIVTDQDGNVLPGKPLVLIDHVPVFNINALLDVPVSEIVKVEVINKTYILGSNSINGIVMITTKGNNYGELDFGSPSIFLELQTLEAPLPDSNPTFETPDSRPDFRTTLYWNPHVLLHGNNGTFDFNASDRRGDYTIVIRGYAPDGTMFYGTRDITIQ